MMSGENAGRTAAQVQQDSHVKDGQKEEQSFAKEKTPDKVLLFSRCYCDNLFPKNRNKGPFFVVGR